MMQMLFMTDVVKPTGMSDSEFFRIWNDEAVAAVAGARLAGPVDPDAPNRKVAGLLHADRISGRLLDPELFDPHSVSRDEDPVAASARNLREIQNRLAHPRSPECQGAIDHQAAREPITSGTQLDHVAAIRLDQCGLDPSLRIWARSDGDLGADLRAAERETEKRTPKRARSSDGETPVRRGHAAFSPPRPRTRRGRGCRPEASTAAVPGFPSGCGARIRPRS